MATPQASSNRPRLSLQIKNVAGSGTRVTRALAMVDPKSPTAFNTLSNVYVTAIERSTPIVASPLTAINMQQLTMIQTGTDVKDLQHRIQTPYAATYPETPLTAHPMSPVNMDIKYPSSMTATPPLSAGPTESNAPKKFTFAVPESTKLTVNTNIAPVADQRTLRRRSTFTAAMNSFGELPYTHPRSLHSILRNSPLPPSSAKITISPRRQSLRLQEKAARRVAYNSPLEQTITTSKYTKSHIDLLCEEASPSSPAILENVDTVLDLALAFTGNETRDGGQTPGPFEEMRRRMASLGTTTPVSPGCTGGIRKRKKKEKKRRWVWTLGHEEDIDEEVGGALAALKAVEAASIAAAERRQDATPLAPQMVVDLPTPSIESQDPGWESVDVEMSDTASVFTDERAVTPGDMELDLKTPTVAPKNPSPGSEPSIRGDRLGSVDLYNPDTGSRHDTPIPPDLLAA